MRQRTTTEIVVDIPGTISEDAVRDGSFAIPKRTQRSGRRRITLAGGSFVRQGGTSRNEDFTFLPLHAMQ